MTGATFSSTHYQEYQKTGDKNIFEEVVEKMILEGVAGMNDTTLAAIKNMPRDKKRMAILRLLMDNSSSHIQMFQKIKGLVNKDISRLEHIKDIIMLLRDYVKVGDVEQKKYGEVMTPLDLVKEMLNKLPEEIWSDPTTKFLDCSNGTGVYPMVAIYKFMRGLEKWEQNEEKRYRYIVENMIYACELQPKNTFLYLCAIDPFDQYDVNVYTGSFLDEGFDYHMKNVWRLDRVTVCSSNPPYQRMDGGGGRGSSAVPIYNTFTEKSYSISDIVSFLTPSRWFVGGRGLDDFREKMINKYNLSYIKHFDGDGSDIFGEGVSIMGGISYFIINKNNSVNHLEINGSLVSKDLIKKCDNLIFKDALIYKIVEKVFTKFDRFLGDDIKSTNYFGIRTDQGKTLRNGNMCEVDKKTEKHLKCYVSLSEGRVKYADISLVSKVDLEKYKVFLPKANGGTIRGIINNSIIGEPYDICSETYLSMIFSSMDEAVLFKKYMGTKLFMFLSSIMKNTQNTSKNTYKMVPCIWMDDMCDEEMNLFFEFSESEISLINKECLKY